MSRRLTVMTFAVLSALVLPSAAFARTATVTSFDGTKLHVNFFAAAGLHPGKRAPTVLMGPGWGSPGDTNAEDSAVPSLGAVGVGTLRRTGFNVLTWDPRGFGKSGGTVEVDSPRYEGRDVSALITWLARRPQAELDHPGDPRVGMAGGSYGGGIQLVSAAIDRRIDAIVPDIAWNSLLTSLDKNDVGKLGWSGLLYLLGNAAGRLNPIIAQAYQANVLGQPLTPAERAFFASRGPGALVGRITVPTPLIQVTPIPITLDGAVHTVTKSLEIIAATDKPHEEFTLQIAASTVAYETQRATGAVDLSRVHIVLPTVDPSASAPGHGAPNPAAAG